MTTGLARPPQDRSLIKHTRQQHFTKLIHFYHLLIKDYYKILGVAPAASLQEIKKSFRRLALQYHPDKNNGDHLSAAQFREIQEAYEVLSDPKQREEYNYKRWYNRSIGESFIKRPLSPAAILDECKLLQSYIASISIFHVNYDAVSKHIRDLLTEDATKILQQFNDRNINEQIIHAILISTDPLPVKYLMPIAEILLQVAGDDEIMKTEIAKHLRHRKSRENWDKYKWVMAVAVTALIIWLMYIVGK